MRTSEGEEAGVTGSKRPHIVAALILELVLLALATAALPALAAPQDLPLDVVVSEIAWMGTTISPNDEWIELYSNTDSPIDLTGWSLSAADGTPSISLNGTIHLAAIFSSNALTTILFPT